MRGAISFWKSKICSAMGWGSVASGGLLPHTALLPNTPASCVLSAALPALLQWGGQLHAALSHAAFRFTEDQDVRLTVGVRAPVRPGRRNRLVPGAAAGSGKGQGRAIAGWCVPQQTPMACSGNNIAQAAGCISLTRPCMRPSVSAGPQVSDRGVGAGQPYLRFQENCWGLTLNRSRSGAVSWAVSYDL